MDGSVERGRASASPDDESTHHKRHQRQSRRGHAASQGAQERAAGSADPSSRRNEIGLTPEAWEDLKRLKSRDPKAYREVELLLTNIEKTPDLGYPLLDEWEGCRAVHCGRDRYRIIWEILSPVEDYDKAGGEVVPIAIFRVGPKTDARGHAIYDDPRPHEG